MHGPDSYLYEINLTLLASLSDEDLADPAIIAQIAPGAAALAALASWAAGALARGVEALAGWLAPPADHVAAEGYWHYPPLC